MTTKTLLYGIVSSVLFNACVSKKVFSDLEEKYKLLKDEYEQLGDVSDNLTSDLDQSKQDLKKLKEQYDKAILERNSLQSAFDTSQLNLENLKNSYTALEKNSSDEIAKNAKKNRELLAQLEAKEIALNAEKERLEKLKNELSTRSQRISELEQIIASKEASMKALKDAISKALINFEGNGLTVEERNGKVYVSMENKLLFKSGSWFVGPEGKKAVTQLGNVLAENPDISILIEGHTDDDPYIGSGQVKGNWDLSTKRATAIVSLLRENNSINPENLTAAGRSEFHPIASNDTPEGKAKNRRIEVILTPKLDELSKLLNRF